MYRCERERQRLDKASILLADKYRHKIGEIREFYAKGKKNLGNEAEWGEGGQHTKKCSKKKKGKQQQGRKHQQTNTTVKYATRRTCF